MAFTLLALVGVRSTAPSGESPLIVAELVAFLEPAAAPAAEPTTGDVELGGARLIPVPEEPTPAPQPVQPEVEAPPPVRATRARGRACARRRDRRVATRRARRRSPRAAARFGSHRGELPRSARRGPSRHHAEPRIGQPRGARRAAQALVVDRAFQCRRTQRQSDVAGRRPGIHRRAQAGAGERRDGDGALAVELSTERDGERLVTELRMSRLAFSNFGQFVNRMGPRRESPRRHHRWALSLEHRVDHRPDRPHDAGIPRQGHDRRRQLYDGRWAGIH